MTDLEKIEQRMTDGNSFTFLQLHSMGGFAVPAAAYRLADRTIQKWRRGGLISHKREGRDFVWSLTDKGRKALS